MILSFFLQSIIEGQFSRLHTVALQIDSYIVKCNDNVMIV